MQAVKEDIKELFHQYSRATVVSIEKIPQSGSDRTYFRIKCQAAQSDQAFSYIATYSNNIKENNTFINFSRHFKKNGCPVPEIYMVNEDQTIYIQEDFGDTSLLNELEEKGYIQEVYTLFQKSLKALAHLQVKGQKGLKYDWCITSREFGRQAIMSDLLYFKYYFLDTLKIPYDKEKLIDNFEALSTYLSHVDHKYFMFRDFQSRNVMIK